MQYVSYTVGGNGSCFVVSCIRPDAMQLTSHKTWVQVKAIRARRRNSHAVKQYRKKVITLFFRILYDVRLRQLSIFHVLSRALPFRICGKYFHCEPFLVCFSTMKRLLYAILLLFGCLNFIPCDSKLLRVVKISLAPNVKQVTSQQHVYSCAHRCLTPLFLSFLRSYQYCMSTKKYLQLLHLFGRHLA